MDTIVGPGGQIVENAVYTKEEVMKRMNWGKTSWLSAQKAGLKVSRKHRRAFVLGKDMIDYLVTAPS